MHLKKFLLLNEEVGMRQNMKMCNVFLFVSFNIRLQDSQALISTIRDNVALRNGWEITLSCRGLPS